MKRVAITDKDTPPTRHPGVDAAVTQMEKALRHLLGSGTRYVLVIAVDRADALDVQAVTDTSPAEALALLRMAQASGFDSLN